MQYQPSREQRALIAELETSISDILPVARLHKSKTESAETWSALEQLGLFGLAVAEEAGGVGLGAVEETLVVISLGRCLAGPTVLATLGAAHIKGRNAIAAPGGRVAAGFRRDGIIAVNDPDAPYILLRSEEGAALHEMPSTGQLINSPWLVDLVRLEMSGRMIATLDAAGLVRLRLIDAAALAGLADAAMAAAVAYAKLREQFGRPIGSFQAVKHHCANMATAARTALDLVTFAAVAIDSGRPDAAQMVESAFVVAASAALENAAKNIQIHGGIGFSDEADAHLFLKRAQLLVAIGGGVEAATDRLASLAIHTPKEDQMGAMQEDIYAGCNHHGRR